MKFTELEWCSPQYQSSLELRHLVLRGPLGLKLTAEELDGEHSQRHYAMLDDSEDVIAIVIARQKTSKLVQLRQMAVHPEHQRQGIGSQLLQACESELSGHGFVEIQVNARSEAAAFYEKHGYQITGEPFEVIKLVHHKMVKKIGE